ncbi:MAG: hypothetical protein Crog4KO_03910 [Crocinitomicaceae bacterium]
MKNALLLFSLLFTFSLSAQFCDTNALIIEEVRASDTDPNIPFELVRHHSFYNPACTPKNVLVVHLVGTFASPYQSVLFPKTAANVGYHVLSLKYENDEAAQTACGNSNDIDCHYKFRKEIIDGEDVSTEVQVDSVNSIQNRLIRLLQYMESNHPTQNWGQYFTGDSIHWQQVMLSGHSQGGGHAAMMAIDRPVKRVIMFASPNDYSVNFSQAASWTNLPHVTADSAYFSFNNVNDQVAQYDWQFGAAQNLGVQGDSTLVDGSDCPFSGSHNLYTAINLSGFGNNHGSVVHDSSVPTDGNGTSIFQDVWLYLLGESCQPLAIKEEDQEFTLYPNPVESVLNVRSSTVIETYRIVDQLGREVQNGTVSANNLQLQLENLPNGVYNLLLSTGSGMKCQIIVKN